MFGIRKRDRRRIFALAEMLIPWYERGMKAAAKIAISLPAETLAQVEALRERTGKSRSAIFAEAVKVLLSREQVDVREQRYVEAYLRRPVHHEETANLAAAAVATWEPWT